MTEVADSTAAVMTADYQGILALMFGDTIEQITTFSRKIFHQTEDSNDRTTIQSEKDVAVAIAPTVSIVQAKAQIVVSLSITYRLLTWKTSIIASLSVLSITLRAPTLKANTKTLCLSSNSRDVHFVSA